MQSEPQSAPRSRAPKDGAREPRDTEQKGTRESSKGASAPIYGIAGWFETPAELYHACEALRDAGYQRFDAHTPFPVHGLEKAMGLRPTRFPWLVLCGGLTGLTFALALAYFTQVIDYPLNISGKQSWSYQAYIPVFFELTILFSGLTCFFGLWAVNGLPRFHHPTVNHPSFHRATDDAFFVSVEAEDPRFDRAETRSMLEGLGAREVEELAP